MSSQAFKMKLQSVNGSTSYQNKFTIYKRVCKFSKWNYNLQVTLQVFRMNVCRAAVTGYCSCMTLSARQPVTGYCSCMTLSARHPVTGYCSCMTLFLHQQLPVTDCCSCMTLSARHPVTGYCSCMTLSVGQPWESQRHCSGPTSSPSSPIGRLSGLCQCTFHLLLSLTWLS